MVEPEEPHQGQPETTRLVLLPVLVRVQEISKLSVVRVYNDAYRLQTNRLSTPRESASYIALRTI